jgi:GT2 family glycosyltransferase
MDLVTGCYRSITAKSTYADIEIIVAHNGRVPPGIPAVRYPDPGPFNLARKMNFLIDRARGRYLILLNDDTEVIEPDWIQALLEFAQQPDVGAVGARLHYTDGRIQHAGVVFGLATLCGHVFMGHPWDCPGAARPREFSAVSGACMMFRRGERMDERFPATFDVDFCLRARACGRRVVYTPHARLFHHESASLKLGGSSYFREMLRFRRRWPGCLPDPFYTADRSDCRHPDLAP